MTSKLPDTDTLIAKIVETKGNLAAVGRAYGTTRQAVSKAVRGRPTLQAAYEEARETMIDNAESMLYSKILGGDMTAIIFFLKTQGKSRGYVERQEINVTMTIRQEIDRMVADGALTEAEAAAAIAEAELIVRGKA